MPWSFEPAILSGMELAEQRRAAEAYNALLRGEAAVSTGGASASPLVYAEQLAIGGAMCTIDIPKIGVYLPVRHGTGVETLERAVGHVVGTSLPVGGAGTHAVLSAHSGMASAKLFTDIDQLVKGDVFYMRTVQNIVSALAKQYSTSREELPAAIRKQADELASSKSELREKSRRLASAESVSLLSTAERIKGIAVVCSVMDGSTANDLKLTADELCKKDSTVPCVSLLFAPNAGGTDYCMACTEDAAYTF